MADRKVLNKYYPPDYDPASIPRLRQPKQRQIQSRIMLPMSVQCTQCGDFVYKGKKFNARKEHVVGEDYLGIKRWRFYFRCPGCLQEMTFKTDPQHGGYEVERGARRNVEPWRDRAREEEEARKAREREDEDVMKRLENKSKDGRRDHELAEVLEELRERNGRGEKLTLDELMEWHVKRKERQQEEDDEKAAKEAFNRRLQQKREGVQERAAVKRDPADDGKTPTIDALDFEVADEWVEEGTTKEAGAAEERAEDDREAQAEENEDEESTQWTSQRKELTASGMSFGSLLGEQKAQKEAASSREERKEGLAPSATLMIVKKRKAELSVQQGGVSSDAVGKKQREDEERKDAPIAIPAVAASKTPSAALSSLLGSYDDDSDDEG